MQILDDTKEKCITLYQAYVKESRLTDDYRRISYILGGLLGLSLIGLIILCVTLVNYKPEPIYVEIFREGNRLYYRLAESFEKKPIEQKKIDIRSFMRSYVEKRHTINNVEDKKNVEFLRNSSESNIFDQIKKDYIYFKEKLDGYIRTVEITDDTFVALGVHIVEFNIIDISPQGTKSVKQWKAKIAYKFKNEPQEIAALLQNPIGAVITSYTIEPKEKGENHVKE
ncbi:MAG: type IV secretion system protein [Sphingobacteriia bacterium]|nr:type IV secretion system protein [Sphingobacteriia bacterium]